MTHTIDIDKLYNEVNSGKEVFLDVRSKEEFEEFSIPNSMNLSVEDIEYGKVPDVPRDKKIYTYCMSGARAEKATKMLGMMGFTNVTNLGGIMNLVK